MHNAVDNKDLQTMKAMRLSKMLVRRSSNAVRKVTVVRVLPANPGAGLAGGGGLQQFTKAGRRSFVADERRDSAARVDFGRSRSQQIRRRHHDWE